MVYGGSGHIWVIQWRPIVRMGGNQAEKRTMGPIKPKKPGQCFRSQGLKVKLALQGRAAQLNES